MDLNVNYDETISIGNQVTEKGGSFESLLGVIDAANTGLQTYWEGSDASKYSNAIAEQAAKMKQLASTINEIGAFLVKVGNAYQEANNANQNAIR